MALHRIKLVRLCTCIIAKDTEGRFRPAPTAEKEHIANREQNVYTLGFIDWGAGEDSPALSPLRIPVIKGARP